MTTANGKAEAANWGPDPEPESDAKLAARWAAQALQEGRYELGRALANIAAQAAQLEARARANVAAELEALAPDAGHDVEIPQIEETAVIPLEQARQARADMFGAPPTEQLAVPSARCEYVHHIDGPGGQTASTCWRPIYLDPNPAPGTIPWRHLDPAYDQDHFAQAPEHLRHRPAD